MSVEHDNRLRETHQEFYCPNGHKQWYTGKTEAEKLKEELKKKERALKRERECCSVTRRRLEAEERENEKLFNKVNGHKGAYARLKNSMQREESCGDETDGLHSGGQAACRQEGPTQH
jgi:hypothetical protein